MKEKVFDVRVNDDEYTRLIYTALNGSEEQDGELRQLKGGVFLNDDPIYYVTKSNYGNCTGTMEQPWSIIMGIALMQDCLCGDLLKTIELNSIMCTASVGTELLEALAQ